jgi:hypothetical protein
MHSPRVTCRSRRSLTFTTSARAQRGDEDTRCPCLLLERESGCRTAPRASRLES